MKAISTIDATNLVGQPVTIYGWVQTVRDMGKIQFIDLRDPMGLLQVVVSDKVALPKLGAEYVVKITGTIRERGERFVNDSLPTGKIELGADAVEVINESAELPFEIKQDTLGINEELRLKYRYLDLRSARMAANLKLRHKVIQFMRKFYDDAGYIEIETPLLTKGTPEGAREFLVPSRLHAENFYVLPQSPQQFKQLLMIAGIGKYYQIAKCLRDEDQRGDRQPEFTQLDIEASFVNRDDILNQTEAMLIQLVAEVTPEKHIQTTPFPRMTYAEAMSKYGTDKPDLRTDKSDKNLLAFVWVTDFPMFEKNKDSGKPDAVHHPFTAPTITHPDELRAADPFAVLSDSYDIVLNGYEIGGGSIRISDSQLQKTVFEILGLSEEEITSRFGHMLEAYRYGAPPHGGIAPGIDRIIMLLAGEPNIREVMAFPKTGDARDPLTGAPSSVSQRALSEANITIAPSKPRK